MSLTKRIIQENFSKEELIEYLSTPNIPVIQQTILKIVKQHMEDELIRIKLLEYSEYMADRFKILGPCKLGHLSIYALKQLGYDNDFQIKYKKLAEYDKELLGMLEKALKDIK